MKRARSRSPVNEHAGSSSNDAELWNDDDDDSLVSHESGNANPLGDSIGGSSSSSSSSGTAVDFGVDPTRDPLLPLLVEALAAMQPGESFADTLKRHGKTASSLLGRLTEVHDALLKQQDLVLMSMRREQVLQRALAEAARAHTALPPAWLLRWCARGTSGRSSAPLASHGPFTGEEMQKWAASGFFDKKPAEVRNLNAAGSAWVPAELEFPSGAK